MVNTQQMLLEVLQKDKAANTHGNDVDIKKINNQWCEKQCANDFEAAATAAADDDDRVTDQV